MTALDVPEPRIIQCAPAALLAEWVERMGRADTSAHAASHGAPPRTLGDVTLYPHQSEGVMHLRRILQHFGGALLADDVGLGKTCTALGVAAAYRRVLVIAPAGLRVMWQRESIRCRVSSDVLSYESLSQGRAPPDVAWDLIVLDEAHHARNPATRRFGALASLAWGRHVLLLSATPIHNRRRDLVTLFSLFLGSGARRMPEGTLSRLIVRRRADDLPSSALLPAITCLAWRTIPESPRVLRALKELPPPLAPADGEVVPALLTIQLIRSWCSSDAALLGVIRRRLARALALEHALANGRHPTRHVLRSWLADDSGALQLAFTALMVPSGANASAAEHLSTLRDHVAALRALRVLVAGPEGRDGFRFAEVAEILRSHAGHRVVLFTHSADTAKALFRALSPSFRTALLTGTGGRIAVGSVSRAEILERFSAGSHARPGRTATASDPRRIDVLVATDVLSEGVDLHGAGVVLHVDLPWTLARLEQRTGRVRRMGSEHTTVSQYAVAPPVRAEELSHVVAHLTSKSAVIRTLIGDSPLLAAGEWPFASDHPNALAPALVQDSMRASLRQLAQRFEGLSLPVERAGAMQLRHPRSVAVAVCPSEHHGALALVEDEGEPLLLVSAGATWSENPVDVMSLLRDLCRSPTPCRENGRDSPLAPDDMHARGTSTPTASPTSGRTSTPRSVTMVSARRTSRVLQSALAWCRQRDAGRDCLLACGADSVPHRRMLHALGAIMARAPRLERPKLLPRVQHARCLALSSHGAGAEHELRRLLDAPLRVALAPHTAAPWLDEVIRRLSRGEPCGIESADPPRSEGRDHTRLLGLLVAQATRARPPAGPRPCQGGAILPA